MADETHEPEQEPRWPRAAEEQQKGAPGAARTGDGQGAEAEHVAHAPAGDEDATPAEGGRTDPDQAADAAARELPPMVEPGLAAELRRWWRYWWRYTLVASLVALFSAFLLFRILRVGGLEQSAAFYVGLPAVIAIVVAITAKPRSAVGVAVIATTIGLMLAGPLLDEGAVCLFFSAPLFYLVAVFVGMIVEAARKAGHRGLAAVAVIPVLLMCLEGVSPATSMPRSETVASERVVHASPAAVEAALARTPAYGRPTSAFLRLGFPRPLHATGAGLNVGDERLVTFTPRRSLGIGAKPTFRSMRLRVTESRPGKVVFTIVQDSTAARWLDLDTAEVAWHATGTRTTVRWTLRYQRTFDPAWYFGPLQRYGMSRAADYLNDTITNPRAAR